MADRLLVREVPEEIYNWIQGEREAKRQTQNEFVLNLLRDAFDSSKQFTLFSPQRLWCSKMISQDFERRFGEVR